MEELFARFDANTKAPTDFILTCDYGMTVKGQPGLGKKKSTLKREGKWMAAISVRSDKVPNVLVFLEVLESLAPQVKSTGIDPLARVRM